MMAGNFHYYYSCGKKYARKGKGTERKEDRVAINQTSPTVHRYPSRSAAEESSPRSFPQWLRIFLLPTQRDLEDAG